MIWFLQGLLLKALDENRSRTEAIELAGITQKEYDEIIKYSKFKGNEFSEEYERIVNERKESLLINLTDNNIMISCELTKITVDDFYNWYDEAKIDDEFYIKSTKILMDKFLKERRSGKTKSESCKTIGLKESVVDYWLKRQYKLFDKFKDDNVKVIVYLILNGFKNNKSKKEIAENVEVSVDRINNYLISSRNGSRTFAELSSYYENEVIPKHLSRFLNEIKNKSFKKSLHRVDLTEDELNYFYKTNSEFHDEYLAIKKAKYVGEILDGRNHQTSIKRSDLSEDEYLQLKDEINEIILKERMEIVKRNLINCFGV